MPEGILDEPQLLRDRDLLGDDLLSGVEVRGDVRRMLRDGRVLALVVDRSGEERDVGREVVAKLITHVLEALLNGLHTRESAPSAASGEVPSALRHVGRWTLFA